MDKRITFFNNIMISLCYYDWKIKITNDSYCNINKKIITINKNCKNMYQMILHEIAHIGTCRFCNQKHNPTFWKHFKDLLYRFLPNSYICTEQLNHKKYMTIGIYSKVYG